MFGSGEDYLYSYKTSKLFCRTVIEVFQVMQIMQVMQVMKVIQFIQVMQVRLAHM